jgi:alpha-glucosidase
VRARLPYLASRGGDALWLSPIHPSPNVDWGYDVADYLDVHPDFGVLADYDALVAEARAHGLDVWLDLVPNHTSDRHSWFAERPEYYVWADRVPNDWTSIFTGQSAWTYDERRGRYYLHQFAPEQPDLDWWNEDVRGEFDRILRFWFDRGVRGIRVDVAHGLVKDRQLRNGVQHMRNRPEVHEIFERWQRLAAAYDPKPVLMGETYVPLDELLPYWQHLDLVQNFDFLNADFTVGELRPVVERTLARVPAGRVPLWFGSNHDHSRMATRWAHGNVDKHRAALFLLLTLPGVAILYGGDEIALQDGDVPDDAVVDLADPPRDYERTPLPWDEVERQAVDPGSVLAWTRELIRRRQGFADGSYESLESPRGVWAYRRGDDTCVINMSATRKRYEGLRLAPWECLIL